MARTTVQSVVIPVQLSFDEGVTWKDLVCLTDYSSPLNNSLNETESFCGKQIGQGNPSMDFSGNAICDLEPGAAEVSLTDLETAMMAKQVILGRVVYPGTGSVGNLLYRKSELVVESTTFKAATNDLIKFEFSLKGQGIPEVVAP